MSLSDHDKGCPCEDGLPDPCTMCGEPADGICKIDFVRGAAVDARVAAAVDAERARGVEVVKELRARRGTAQHRPRSPEAYRQEGELNMLDHVLAAIEGGE